VDSFARIRSKSYKKQEILNNIAINKNWNMEYMEYNIAPAFNFFIALLFKISCLL